MTKYEIIDKLARQNEIEKIVYKMVGTSKNPLDAPKDLIQDIYIILLEKDPQVIEDLYNNNELGFYILRICRNQIFSCNSPYYYNYVRFRVNSDEIEKAVNFISE